MRIGIIDRFEGHFAVVEIAGVTKNIVRRKIPAEAREGDVIVFNDRRWTVDQEATQLRREVIKAVADEVWE
jgi:hypothetical protein